MLKCVYSNKFDLPQAVLSNSYKKALDTIPESTWLESYIADAHSYIIIIVVYYLTLSCADRPVYLNIDA